MPVGEPIVHSSQRDRQLTPLLHCGFLLFGVVNTLLGPILPMLVARWRLHDAEAGTLFIAQFTGAMIGSALSSPMIERLGSLRLMTCGYAAMAAASLVWASTLGGLVSCRFSALVSHWD